MSKFTAIFALILGAALALFVVENQGLITLHFLWFAARGLPMSLALLAAIAFGLLIGLLLALPGRLTAGRREQRLRRNVGRLEAQATPVTTFAPTLGATHATPIEGVRPRRARPQALGRFLGKR
jgi:uncharacterized integral membrane protein